MYLIQNRILIHHKIKIVDVGQVHYDVEEEEAEEEGKILQLMMNNQSSKIGRASCRERV